MILDDFLDMNVMLGHQIQNRSPSQTDEGRRATPRKTIPVKFGDGEPVVQENVVSRRHELILQVLHALRRLEKRRKHRPKVKQGGRCPIHQRRVRAHKF